MRPDHAVDDLKSGAAPPLALLVDGPMPAYFRAPPTDLLLIIDSRFLASLQRRLTNIPPSRPASTSLPRVSQSLARRLSELSYTTWAPKTSRAEQLIAPLSGSSSRRVGHTARLLPGQSGRCSRALHDGWIEANRRGAL